ncbi:MAG TPA: hypothetical protein VFT22_11400 [Kofleriaceae bacterium]|nr:hypothetical protein [Kofleriaceae bacterium]
MKTAIGGLVIGVVSSTIAAAQPAPEPGAAPRVAGSTPVGPTRQPGFVSIDRIDDTSRAGLEASYLEPNMMSASGPKPRLMRFEAHVSYVDQPLGLGGYVLAPFGYIHTGDGATSRTTSALGDVEFGAIYIPRLPSENVGVVFHAGIAAPTGEDNAAGFITNSVALTELYNGLPKGTTAKLGVSPMFRYGNLFARLDLGVDWNIDAKDATVGTGLHYNAGLGIDLGAAAVMLESENMSLLRINGNGGAARGATLNALVVSVRASLRPVSPYVGVVIPCEEDISDLTDFAITLGSDFRFD